MDPHREQQKRPNTTQGKAGEHTTGATTPRRQSLSQRKVVAKRRSRPKERGTKDQRNKQHPAKKSSRTEKATSKTHKTRPRRTIKAPDWQALNSTGDLLDHTQDSSRYLRFCQKVLPLYFMKIILPIAPKNSTYQTQND
eukprot:6474557-Amphidinium_carterae.1